MDNNRQVVQFGIPLILTNITELPSPFIFVQNYAVNTQSMRLFRGMFHGTKCVRTSFLAHGKKKNPKIDFYLERPFAKISLCPAG